MQNKKSFRISIRVSQRQFADLATFAKSHQWTKSEALQKLLDNVSANIQLKTPSKAFVQRIPSPIIASNAKTITAMNQAYGITHNTCKQINGLDSKLCNFATFLGHKKMTPEVTAICQKAFNVIGAKLVSAKAAVKLVYEKFDNFEKNFDNRFNNRKDV